MPNIVIMWKIKKIIVILISISKIRLDKTSVKNASKLVKYCPFHISGSIGPLECLNLMFCTNLYR